MAEKTLTTGKATNGETPEGKIPKGMISLDFSGPMLDNRGRLGKDALWETLNDWLATEMKPNLGTKLYGWQRQLQGGGFLLLDKSDYELLRDMVKATPRLQSFAHGQLEEVINKVKL